MGMVAADMARIDLYVSPEEYPIVLRLGAHWDERLKCWYIDTTAQAQRFARWLGEADARSDAPFDIRSHLAYVASRTVRCGRCQYGTEAMCVYCRSGTVLAEPLERFTVYAIRAVDGALARQLERWPALRFDQHHGGYVNHCTNCNAILTGLHSEPHHPLYDVEHSSAVVLTRLRGTVRLSGDYSVSV